MSRKHRSTEKTDEILLWHASTSIETARKRLTNSIVKSAGHLAIHFGEVSFLSSRMLTYLMEARVFAIKLGKRLSLHVDSSTLLRLFRLVGFDRYFEVVPGRLT